MSTPRARVVLVHGTRFSHTQWAGYDALLPDCEVVTPDLPGHGTAIGETFSGSAAVARIHEAVESGTPGLPVVLVGHSLGGYMAQLYATAYPDRLAGLVIVGASAVPVGPGAAFYRGVAHLIDRVGHDRWGRGADAVVRRLAGDQALVDATAGGASYDATRQAWATVMGECRPEGLREVACPVVLLGGQFDQLHVQARRYAACCRDGRVVRVRGATHMVTLTHRPVVAGVVTDLVAEVARPRG